YWAKQPLHIGGDPRRFENLPGLSRFPQLLVGRLTGNRWVPRDQKIAQGSFVDSGGKVREIPIPYSTVPEAYNAGLSLCFDYVDHEDAALPELVKSIQNHTDFPGAVGTTCYLTPPHAGSAMHFDCEHVFFCQVSGRKHWKISRRPAFEAPPVNLGYAYFDQ